MDLHLSPFAESQAPRYTSYPSANHFDGSVDSALYGRWLAALEPRERMSLYVHVPYCKELCWYCGCNTFLTRGGDLEDFVATLMMEIDLVASSLGARGISEIHWGGGTPNILSAQAFLRLVRHIEFWFDLQADLSHAIELDPRHVTRELAQTYIAAGVTRASLGVQDLNPHVQEAIGRLQPFEQVRDAVEVLRRAGLRHLSFDLMYGLPNQTCGDLVRTIELAVQLRPQRIALFGYAHVPWFKRRQRLIDANTLPSASARFEQADFARGLLVDLGYEGVGLDHYALPDDELAIAAKNHNLKRNFQGYVATHANAIIGLGPSAISHTPFGYAQNIAHISGWRHALEENRLPVKRGHALSPEDSRRGAIIQEILCAFEVDLALWGGWDMFPDAYSSIAQLARADIVEVDGACLRIPPRSRQFSRLVAMAFDAYGQPSQPAHARVI